MRHFSHFKKKKMCSKQEDGRILHLNPCCTSWDTQTSPSPLCLSFFISSVIIFFWGECVLSSLWDLSSLTRD